METRNQTYKNISSRPSESKDTTFSKDVNNSYLAEWSRVHPG
jgi:hypothetical protein